MEQMGFYILTITFLGIFLFFVSFRKKQKNRLPSPPSLPVIGHLHLINNKKPFHRALYELSIKYGPIYFIKLGRVPIVVISSPTLVEECFIQNDIVLANRPKNRSTLHFNYDSTTLATLSYGSLWRDLRKITAIEFFSTARVSSYGHVREEEARSLVMNILNNTNDVDQFVQVEMRSRLFECVFNIIMRMLTGKRYTFEGADKLFYEVLHEVFKLSGASNPIDFFPLLRWINFGNIEGKMIDVKGKLDTFLNGIIEECKTFKRDHNYDKTDKMPMIYKLFDLQESDAMQYSNQTIKGIILIMLAAGIETSVTTMEWTLALLLNHQNILDKARLEIDNSVGRDRLVDESDFDKLHFTRNIIDETLRLFPPGPLLIPHESSEICTIAGFHVPKGTMVLINAWAIQRDPNVWDDPLSFKPERFEGANVNEFQSSFVPFGMGRRSCPGASLAKKLMTLILSALLQCFDWENVNGVNVELIEGSGLAMPMLTPLSAMCKPKRDMINVLSNI